MAPKYGVGKRIQGARGAIQGLHGVISNRIQINSCWWLDVTWDNGQLARVQTGDVSLEGALVRNDAGVYSCLAVLPNRI
jgi:hypothetical protein